MELFKVRVTAASIGLCFSYVHDINSCLVQILSFVVNSCKVKRLDMKLTLLSRSFKASATTDR